MIDNRPVCDIPVRNARAKRKHNEIVLRNCSKTGRYYDRDDGKTRCSSHQRQHDTMIARYLADMAATRATHPHLVN